ncbi:MAG TPA: polysaccharide deacetylase family protein [Xanthobacteraceae bacterium]|nr:polysaccharide deacetylase family protein [Xanthobacteraceae bacterium]
MVDMRLIVLGGMLAAGLSVCPALAADCPGNPDALGTARTITVDPAKMPRIGSMSYPQTLPLERKEVVLTFDDGPQPKYTGPVLDTLAHECVEATFFIIGSLAKEYPDWVQRVARAGHSIGNHSETHPRYIDKIPQDKALKEIDDATVHIEAALAPAGYKMAPFFRFPGFRHTEPLDQYVNKQGFAVIGADFPADDWTFISPETVLKRALDRLERRGSGILLLHDIHQRTVTILPRLLRELKARGYQVVQMVPPGGAEPAIAAAPAAPASAAEAAPKEAGAETPASAAALAAPAVAAKDTVANALPETIAAIAASAETESKAASLPQALAKDTAVKGAAKETDSKQAEPGAVQQRHTASLRRHPTRHAEVKTNARNLRDSPD